LKRFFLLFVLIFQVHASIDINSSSVKLDYFTMPYYLDESEQLTLDDIQDIEFNLTTPNRVSLGKNKNCVWYKLELENSTTELKELFMHFKNAQNMAHIDYFELGEEGN